MKKIAKISKPVRYFNREPIVSDKSVKYYDKVTIDDLTNLYQTGRADERISQREHRYYDTFLQWISYRLG